MSPLHRTHRRLHLPLGTDALAVVEARGGPVFAWSQGPGRPSYYAAGCVRTAEVDGEDVYSALAQSCSRVSEQLTSSSRDLTAGHVPLWVGSIACLPGQHRRAHQRSSPGGPWRDWPDARLWIPRVLIVDDGFGLLTAVVTTDGRPAKAWPETMSGQAPRRLRTGGPELVGGDPRVAYERRVGRAVREIMNSDVPSGLKKVVVARSQRVQLHAPPSLAELFAAAKRQEPSATHALVHWPGAGTMLSSTPERLVAVDGLHLQTEALAGTARYSGSDAEADATRALLHSSKDQHEHQLVVDHLRAALAPACGALSIPPAPTVRRLRSLLHLETPITARLRRSRHILEIAARLHPTPAIVGTSPKAAARWLAAHEGLDRGHYAGPVGWFDARGFGDLAIAIRSALIRGTTAWAFAGAGIVAASDPTAEWRETEAKLATALNFLQTAAPAREVAA